MTVDVTDGLTDGQPYAGSRRACINMTQLAFRPGGLSSACQQALVYSEALDEQSSRNHIVNPL